MLERTGYGDTYISNQDLFAFENDTRSVHTGTKNDRLLSALGFFWCGTPPNFNVMKNAAYSISNLHPLGHLCRRGGQRGAEPGVCGS